MPHPSLSLRIDLPDGRRFGPGKAALLRQLIGGGSIRAAAKALEMSYPRALKLVDQMNTSFAAPLIETQHGGADGGGACITQTGRDVLAAYTRICETSATTSAAALDELSALL